MADKTIVQTAKGEVLELHGRVEKWVAANPSKTGWIAIGLGLYFAVSVVVKVLGFFF